MSTVQFQQESEAHLKLMHNDNMLHLTQICVECSTTARLLVIVQLHAALDGAKHANSTVRPDHTVMLCLHAGVGCLHRQVTEGPCVPSC